MFIGYKIYDMRKVFIMMYTISYIGYRKMGSLFQIAKIISKDDCKKHVTLKQKDLKRSNTQIVNWRKPNKVP